MGKFARLTDDYDGLATFMQMLGSQLPVTITLHPLPSTLY